jgi:RNA polymerase sigma factor (sigma-70 family)
MPYKHITKISDLTLVKKVKQNADSEAFTEICRRYQNIFYRMCQKYSTVLLSNNVYLKDIFDEKNMILLHCIKTFNPTKKTKLSTYIGNYARYLCLNAITEHKFTIPYEKDEICKLKEEQRICNIYFGENDNEEDNLSFVKDALDSLEDKRIFKIFKYRYSDNKKMTWHDVSKRVNLSSQTVSALHKRGLKLLKSRLKNKSHYV